jgi:hypothetical protein
MLSSFNQVFGAEPKKDLRLVPPLSFEQKLRRRYFCYCKANWAGWANDKYESWKERLAFSYKPFRQIRLEDDSVYKSGLHTKEYGIGLHRCNEKTGCQVYLLAFFAKNYLRKDVTGTKEVNRKKSANYLCFLLCENRNTIILKDIAGQRPIISLELLQERRKKKAWCLILIATGQVKKA